MTITDNLDSGKLGQNKFVHSRRHGIKLKPYTILFLLLLPVLYNIAMAFLPALGPGEPPMGRVLIYSPDSIENMDIKKGDIIPAVYRTTGGRRIFTPPEFLLGEHDWDEKENDIRFAESFENGETRYGREEFIFRHIILDGEKYIFLGSSECAPAGCHWTADVYRVEGKTLQEKAWLLIDNATEFADAILVKGDRIYIYAINEYFLFGTGQIRVLDGKIRLPSLWEAMTIPWKLDLRVKLIYSILFLALFILGISVLIGELRKIRGKKLIS